MKIRLLLSLITLAFTTSSVFALISPTMVDSITMRDGKKLAADIYIPDSGTGTAYSVILVQTPYNRLAYRVIGLPLAGNDVTGSHYAFVIADWRGFYGSSAAAVAGYDRGKDGYDLVEWIAQQSWSNGRVGTWGPSALGKIQFMTAKKRPPHLICSVPVVAFSQMDYEEYYPGGVYRTEYVEQLDALGYGLSLAVDPHPVYDNVWQYFYEPSGWYPDSINVPMLMIGGWYDHNISGMFELYHALHTSAGAAVRDDQFMVWGPWSHGRVGLAQQGELFYNEAAGWSDSLALEFFDHYLDQTDSSWNASPYIRYFQMGTNDWHESATWPVGDASPYPLYFYPGGLLYPEYPTAPGNFGILTYDPADPSPTIGGATLRTDLLQGPYDQSDLVEGRNDMLKFTSIVLGQDVVMRGPARVHLFVSCDRKDTDFAIRLTDVYPDGRSMLLSEGIRRLRFRNGYTAADTAVAVPGTIYELDVELPDIANTFLAGHRIRVDVSSSNYPRFDCNLNNGLAMYTAGDTMVATSYVYVNSAMASYIELPLLNFFGGIASYDRDGLSFKAFPNPANQQVTLQFQGGAGSGEELKIFSFEGACVYKQTLSGKQETLTVSTAGWAAGLYFIAAGQERMKIVIVH